MSDVIFLFHYGFGNDEQESFAVRAPTLPSACEKVRHFIRLNTEKYDSADDIEVYVLRDYSLNAEHPEWPMFKAIVTFRDLDRVRGDQENYHDLDLYIQAQDRKMAYSMALNMVLDKFPVPERAEIMLGEGEWKVIS